MLDAYGELAAAARSVEEAYASWKAARDALGEHEEALRQAAREKDYLQHVQTESSSWRPKRARRSGWPRRGAA